MSQRMQKKTLFLINDLVACDEQVFPENKTITRKAFAEQPDFVKRLIEIIMIAGQDL